MTKALMTNLEKKWDESMNENENAAGKRDEETETVSKDDVTMAEDTPI